MPKIHHGRRTLNSRRRYGGLWSNYISPAIYGAARYVRNNPKKVLAGTALGLGALGLGMYKGYIPSPQFLRDAGNAIVGRISPAMSKARAFGRDIGYGYSQGLSGGRDLVKGPSHLGYRLAKSLGHSQLGLARGWAMAPRVQMQRNWFSPNQNLMPTTGAYNRAYDVGQWLLSPTGRRVRYAAAATVPLWGLGAGAEIVDGAKRRYRRGRK
jgi:hypothetical protein